MSCYWDIYCLDCGDRHDFQNMNRQLGLMRALVANASLIAQAAPMAESLRAANLYVDFELTVLGEPLRPTWFAQHWKHRLVPRDEYGRCDDECAEFFKCGECGHQKTCRRPNGHQGQHAVTRDDGGK